MLRVNRQGREADHFYLVPRLKMVELNLHSPIRLHGMVLKNIIKYREKFTFFILPWEAIATLMKKFIIFKSCGILTDTLQIPFNLLFDIRKRECAAGCAGCALK
jgi:hypothetical protein